MKKLSKHDIAEPSKIDEEDDVQELLFEKRRLKQMMIQVANQPQDTL